MPGKSAQFWNGVTLVTTQLLLSLIIFSAVLAILVFLTRKRLRKYKPVDLAIFDWLQKNTTPFRTRFMLFFTFIGKHHFLIPANLVLLFYFLFWDRHSWFSIRVAAVALSSLVLMLLLKIVFRRKRPLAPLLKAVKGLSFPSGHAITAVTFYGLVIYIIFHTVNDKWLTWFLTAVLVLVILLIGFSRVYLRVHYASDVLAGFIIGILWLFISLIVLNNLEEYFREKPADAGEVVYKESFPAANRIAIDCTFA